MDEKGLDNMSRERIGIAAAVVVPLAAAFGVGWLGGAGQLRLCAQDTPFVSNVAAAPRIPKGTGPVFLRTVAQTPEEVADLPAGAVLAVVSTRMGTRGGLEAPCPDGWRPGRDEAGQAIFTPANAHLIRLDGRVVDGNGRALPLLGRHGMVQIPLHPVCVKE